MGGAGEEGPSHKLNCYKHQYFDNQNVLPVWLIVMQTEQHHILTPEFIFFERRPTIFPSPFFKILHLLCITSLQTDALLPGDTEMARDFNDAIDVSGWRNWKSLRGPPFDIRGGGGAGVFVAGKLFISTGFGGALKISHFITCLYRSKWK